MSVHCTDRQKITKNMPKIFVKLFRVSTLYPDSTIWIGGDANLPGIEWDTTSIKGNRYTIPINNTIINTMFDAGCEQVVNFATRAVNTLNLFFTHRPSLVNKCLPLPGLSDHDIVLVDTNITPARQKPLKRLIYLWKKVNITNVTNNLKVSLDKFMDCSNMKTPINNLWSDFKTICLASRVLAYHVIYIFVI